MVEGRRGRGRRALPLLMWSGIALLVAIGVASALGRALSVAQTPPTTLADTRVREVLPATELRALVEFERKFTDHPRFTFLHVAAGGVFLLLAPFQFSSRIRTRHLFFHRWSGRVLVALAVIVGVSAFLLALPAFGGVGESSATILFGAIFLAFVVSGFVAIRRGDAARHREWMIRAFAVALGVSAVRIVGASMAVLTPSIGPRERIGLAFWTGWVVSLAAAEIWIRKTRPRRVAAGSAREEGSVGAA